MTKGYVILAQNTVATNYVECAEALAMSIKIADPSANITLISDDKSDCSAFDQTVKLPYGDLAPNSDWKLVNDWQVYEASPYDYTIKLEADMYIPHTMDYFFERFKDMHVCVCDKITDYKGDISTALWYRQFTSENQLPNIYNAITYFDKSDFSETFFSIIKDVFDNWDKYKEKLICNKNEIVTTDWAYSIACHIMGVENTTHPNGFRMVHMKQYINNLLLDDWTNELVYEFSNPLRIHTIPQIDPVHYHIKSFAKKLKDAYA